MKTAWITISDRIEFQHTNRYFICRDGRWETTSGANMSPVSQHALPAIAFTPTHIYATFPEDDPLMIDFMKWRLLGAVDGPLVANINQAKPDP